GTAKNSTSACSVFAIAIPDCGKIATLCRQTCGWFTAEDEASLVSVRPYHLASSVEPCLPPKRHFPTPNRLDMRREFLSGTGSNSICCKSSRRSSTRPSSQSPTLGSWHEGLASLSIIRY